eukprot:CAMPEP_0169415140 /NCGR_PEP_ID=MMETSP1017-20121227/62382_1 /TAXON_ID=342587 /ORGANISM="Karlodinium micrum, Strain CCMP2283" /LENGTH=134 /DNA_ID=CAMNT_0009522905 /DNA_START=90 /DNA_END=491 /DNA_ORIENTATION=-
MKVRIQAAQALMEVPSDQSFWEPAESDFFLVATIDALQSVKDGVPANAVASSPGEAKQFATYLETLRAEIYRLGEHWATCSSTQLGSVAQARLQESLQAISAHFARQLKSHVAAVDICEGQENTCTDAWNSSGD